MPLLRKRVPKGVPKPGKGHFGDSPEFISTPTGVNQKPTLRKQKKKVKT